MYKNSKFEPLKSAYEKEMISEKILAEFFSKYPELDLSDEYFTENDDISVLNKETIVLIKNMYLGHIRRNTKNESYKDLTVSDIYIKKYYKEFGNNYFGVIIGLNVKTKNKITEEVGNYTYIHREYEGLLLRHKTKSTVYHDLSDSYILKIINDKDLELFFKDYPEYKGK